MWSLLPKKRCIKGCFKLLQHCKNCQMVTHLLFWKAPAKSVCSLFSDSPGNPHGGSGTFWGSISYLICFSFWYAQESRFRHHTYLWGRALVFTVLTPRVDHFYYPTLMRTTTLAPHKTLHSSLIVQPAVCWQKQMWLLFHCHWSQALESVTANQCCCVPPTCKRQYNSHIMTI